MVADLARNYGWRLEEIIKGGYFRAHRMWDVLNEIKAHDLFEYSVALFSPNMNDEARGFFFENLEKRQPRRHPTFDGQVTPEMLAEMKKFEDEWNKNGRR